MTQIYDSDPYFWVTDKFISDLMKTNYKLRLSSEIELQDGNLLYVGNVNILFINNNFDLTKVCIINNLQDAIPCYIKVQWMVNLEQILKSEVQTIFTKTNIDKVTLYDKSGHYTVLTRWSVFSTQYDIQKIVAYIPIEANMLD
jgi:hypothetical protein